MALKKAKTLIKRWLRYPKPYSFQYTPQILSQKITFAFREKVLAIESDASTPLYEMVSEIIGYDCYFIDQMDFSIFTEKSIALDVGANIGIVTLVLATIFPGHILCFEPVAENCMWLAHNLKINGIRNVSILQKALCLNDGPVNFFKKQESVSGSLLYSAQAERFEVEGMSVKKVHEQFPQIDLMKLDCEGAEHELIPELLTHFPHTQYVTAEIHDIGRQKNLASISRHLQNSGYEVLTKPEFFERRNFSCLLGARGCQLLQEI